MKDKSKLVTLIVVIAAIISVVGNYLYDKIIEKNKENEINIVTNYSNFYTVNSCVYRTITYISMEDSETLMKLISEQYKKDNNITSENVLSLFPSIEINSTFESRKMYYEKLDNNISKFYVYGYIKDNQILDDFEVTDIDYKETYFIVYLDFDNKIFSIEPYDGELFIGGDNNEE